jgi:hypothetical protein
MDYVIAPFSFVPNVLSCMLGERVKTERRKVKKIFLWIDNK